MFFELFVVFTLLVVGFAGLGLMKRRWAPFIVVFFLMVLTGSILVSDGMRYESGSEYNQDTGVTLYLYDTLRVEQDTTIAMLGLGYFWGAWLIPAVALGSMLWGRVVGVET